MLWLQVGNTSWKKIQSNLWRKQILVIFNDCQDTLQSVDEIISQLFPVIRVFNQRIAEIFNIKVGGFILQLFFKK